MGKFNKRTFPPKEKEENIGINQDSVSNVPDSSDSITTPANFYVEINEEGELVIKRDGKIVHSVNVRGPQGKPGKDGDTWRPIFSNDLTKLCFENKKGERSPLYDIQGKNGRDGKTYTPHISGSWLWFEDEDGNRPFEKVRIKDDNGGKGDKGDKGEKGDKGDNGKDGHTYVPHFDGTWLWFEDNVSGQRPFKKTRITSTSSIKWTIFGFVILSLAVITLSVNLVLLRNEALNDLGDISQYTEEYTSVETQEAEHTTSQVVNLSYTNRKGETFTYTGETLDGIPNGKGEGRYKYGKYIGEYYDGLMHGDGVFTTTNGENTFTGSFKDNSYYEGVLTLTNGNYFKGIFKDGDPYNGDWYNQDNTISSTISNGKKH